MTMDFPRLLVATEFAPNSAGGGAAVVRQMLKDWPAEKLFWWSSYPERNQLFGRKVASHRVALIPQKLYPNRRWRAQRAWLLETFWVPWAARHFRKTLETVKPEAIWVIPHGQAIPPIAGVLKDSKIRFHVSIHDYMDDRSYGERYGIERSRRFAVMVDQLYTIATTRDAIGQTMADDLRARTGRDGSINHAGLEKKISIIFPPGHRRKAARFASPMPGASRLWMSLRWWPKRWGRFVSGFPILLLSNFLATIPIVREAGLTPTG
jgi:hypothetical protein